MFGCLFVCVNDHKQMAVLKTNNAACCWTLTNESKKQKWTRKMFYAIWCSTVLFSLARVFICYVHSYHDCFRTEAHKFSATLCIFNEKCIEWFAHTHTHTKKNLSIYFPTTEILSVHNEYQVKSTRRTTRNKKKSLQKWWHGQCMRAVVFVHAKR